MQTKIPPVRREIYPSHIYNYNSISSSCSIIVLLLLDSVKFFFSFHWSSFFSYFNWNGLFYFLPNRKARFPIRFESFSWALILGPFRSKHSWQLMWWQKAALQRKWRRFLFTLIKIYCHSILYIDRLRKRMVLKQFCLSIVWNSWAC